MAATRPRLNVCFSQPESGNAFSLLGSLGATALFKQFGGLVHVALRFVNAARQSMMPAPHFSLTL
jgi:hypothetical protein